MHKQGNTTAGRLVVLLHDSGALQSLVSKECLNAGDYVDTLEYRLIQGILGQPTEIPLVEVSVESDKNTPLGDRKFTSWSEFSYWQ